MASSLALIIAQATYSHWQSLETAASAARLLATELEQTSFEIAGKSQYGGVSRTEAVTAIQAWLNEADRFGSLVLLWTGHGDFGGGNHFLICQETPREADPMTALDASAIGHVIASSRAEKVLVIIDACYAGAAATALADSFARVMSTHRRDLKTERAIAVIASCHALDRAREGNLSGALREVLLQTSSSRRWKDGDEYIHTEFLARARQSYLGKSENKIEYRADGFPQEFLPNPRYRPTSSYRYLEEWSPEADRTDFESHFDVSARGIEVGESGWFFSGRDQLLRDLVSWLNSDHNGVRVVTGPPGSGKSAVIGRVVTLSVRRYHAEALARGHLSTDAAAPAPGVIDVAIHARGKTVNEFARRIATALALPSQQDTSIELSQLLAEIGRVPRRLTIVVDSLDEAAGGKGEDIARYLLAPAASLSNVRILVGTRRRLDGKTVSSGEHRHEQLIALFGSNAVIDDLEDQETTRQDISDYVFSRLKHYHARESEPVIRNIAERIALSAAGAFLNARIVSRTLSDARDLAALDLKFPKTATEAFVRDLNSRFSNELV